MKHIKHLYDTLSTYQMFSFALIVMTGLFVGRIMLGKFSTPSALDSIGHVVFIAAGAPLILTYIAKKKWLPHLGAAQWIFVTIMIGIVMEVAWEMLEFFLDTALGLSWQPNNTDTMLDIILGVCGAIFGAVVFRWRYYRRHSIS